MATTLKPYFPMLKERDILLAEIESRQELKQMYSEWTAEQQEEFLDFCTGVRGIRFLYDSFFKEIMNPETTEERLEEFLSLVLKERVQILETLPPDSVRIADETSLLVMDIVVQLEDGRIVNLEVQKIGYKFPGERCACYSCDLLLRQYKRVRSQKKKNFSYKDIKGVYTIVLYEKSPKEFHKFPNEYLHHTTQKFDTGLELNLLQEYMMIPLDIYKEIYHNKINNKCPNPFDNKLQAWLALFSMDEPDVIIQLITEFPEFKAIYEDAYRMCQNTEEVMQMFSAELAELDRNTVQLMIDEMQDEINAQKKELEEQAELLKNSEQAMADKDKEHQKMLQHIYNNVQDIEQVAQLTGCSIDEIKEAIQ